VSAIGRPRATRDVDVVVWMPFARDWPRLVSAMSGHDLEFRAGGSLEFALTSRVLLLRHVPTGIDVDVSFGALDVEEQLIARARRIPESGLSLPLPRPEHLMILKAIAARPRDAADIEGLLETHPALDRDEVRAAVVELAELLESPELVESLDRVLSLVPRA
jgi:hypothetical protein